MNPTILDTNNFFQVDKDNGIKYQYYKYTQATNTTVTSIIQADLTGAAMSYVNNNIVVNQNGVTCTPLTITCPNLLTPLTIKNASNVSLCTIDNIGSMVLAGNISTSGNISCTGSASSTNFSGTGGFSYFYDNALTGNSRILTDFSAGPEYINMTILSGGNSNYISIRPTYVRTGTLEAVATATSNPLTLKNSLSVAVCTFSNTGGIAASGTITSAGNTVLTTT